MESKPRPPPLFMPYHVDTGELHGLKLRRKPLYNPSIRAYMYLRMSLPLCIYVYIYIYIYSRRGYHAFEWSNSVASFVYASYILAHNNTTFK